MEIEVPLEQALRRDYGHSHDIAMLMEAEQVLSALCEVRSCCHALRLEGGIVGGLLSPADDVESSREAVLALRPVMLDELRDAQADLGRALKRVHAVLSQSSAQAGSAAACRRELDDLRVARITMQLVAEREVQVTHYFRQLHANSKGV
jgi:hypothetical protein